MSDELQGYRGPSPFHNKPTIIWECLKCEVRWKGTRDSVCWVCSSAVAAQYRNSLVVPKGTSTEHFL